MKRCAILLLFSILIICSFSVAFADDVESYEAYLVIYDNSIKEYEEVYTIANIPKNGVLYVKSELENGMAGASYYWDDSEIITSGNIENGMLEVEIPEEFEIGSKHELSIFAYNDENCQGDNTYYITIVDEMNEFISIGIKEPYMEYPRDFSSVFAKYNEKVYVVASSFNDKLNIEYSWWDEPVCVYEGKELFFIMNCCSAADNEEHYLQVRAITDNAQTDLETSVVYIYE